MSYEGPITKVIDDPYWKSNNNISCGCCGDHLADSVCPICGESYKLGEKLRCDAEIGHYSSPHRHYYCEEELDTKTGKWVSRR